MAQKPRRIAVPVPTHFRFTARGVFFNSPEEWSFGFHMSRDNNGSTAHPGDVDQAAVTSAFAAFFGGGTPGSISSDVKMTDWRCYEIGNDGLTVGNPLVVDVTGDSIAGTAGTKYPPQVALCATLVAVDRGPAKFGRFYIPSPADGLNSDWRLTVAQATAYANKSTQLLKSVSDAIDLVLGSSSTGLNVSSRGGSGAGTKQEIDHVECGRVLDTVRSRRRSLLEERVVDGHIDW